MSLMLQCPHCKRLLGAEKAIPPKCESRSGKGCGRPIKVDQRIFYIQWRDPQGKVRQKKIGPSREAARNEERRILKDVAEDRYIDRRHENQITVAQHVKDDYRPFCETHNRGWGLRNKHRHLDDIMERWGTKRLQGVTTDDVEKWRYEFAERGKRIAWNRLFQTIRAMYRRAVEKKIIEELPFSVKNMLFKEDHDRVRWLTDDEEKSLLDACAPHLRPIVLTAMYTGLRKSDLLSLRLGNDVDLENRKIHRKQAKTNDVVDIPLVDEVYDCLTEIVARGGKEPGDLLFTYNGAGIGDVKVAFNHAVERAGILDPRQERIKDLSFHDLRHVFACKLVQAGVPLYVVQKLLGHKSQAMTQRYCAVMPATAVSQMAKISRHKKGKVVNFSRASA